MSNPEPGIADKQSEAAMHEDGNGSGTHGESQTAEAAKGTNGHDPEPIRTESSADSAPETLKNLLEQVQIASASTESESAVQATEKNSAKESETCESTPQLEHAAQENEAEPQSEIVKETCSSAAEPVQEETSGQAAEAEAVHENIEETVTTAACGAVASSSDPESGEEVSAPSEDEAEGRKTFTKIKAYHILEEVLENKAEEEALPEEVKKRLRYPILLDIVLGIGLLVSVGGFTVGLFNMYLVHAATDAINKANYEAAIAILRGAPLAEVFAAPGSEPAELMSQAVYLDALEKIKDNRVESALHQLRLIKPGSKFFAVAQHVIDENTEEADVLLEGGAEQIETEPVIEKKTAYEKAVTDE